jgi:hypothetical protein
MKRTAARTMLSFVVFALVLAPGGSTYAEVTGRTFHVTVKSSFGTTFGDCFRFDAPGAGDLSIDGLGQTLTYRHGQLDAVDTRFKAVTRSGQAFSIMFYGDEVDALEQLTGEAVSTLGDTFVFSGQETMSCVAGPADPSVTSPYMQ